MLTNIFARKQNQILDELYKVSRIASAGSQARGIQKVIAYAAEELAKLGFENHFVKGDNANVPLLESTYKSNAKNPLKIALVAHADTVATLRWKRHIKINGDYIIGPGVADNKGGIITMLAALRKFLVARQSIPFEIRVIISSEEEIGSPSFQNYFQQIKKNLDFCFGFEPALGDGDIINQRNGNYWVEVIAKGIEAHCGRAKGEELNAFHDFSQKYQKLLKQVSPHNDLRLHLGSIQSNTSTFNIVCGLVRAKIDIRFSEIEDLNVFLPKLHRIFRADIAKNIFGESVQYDFEVHDFCPPMRNQNSTYDFVQTYLDTVERLEKRRPDIAASGGASDLCYLNTKNNVCLDGFGPIANGMHRQDESVYIPSLTTRSEAFCSLLNSLAQRMEASYGNSISC